MYCCARVRSHWAMLTWVCFGSFNVWAKEGWTVTIDQTTSLLTSICTCCFGCRRSWFVDTYSILHLTPRRLSNAAICERNSINQFVDRSRVSFVQCMSHSILCSGISLHCDRVFHVSNTRPEEIKCAFFSTTSSKDHTRSGLMYFCSAESRSLILYNFCGSHERISSQRLCNQG